MRKKSAFFFLLLGEFAVSRLLGHFGRWFGIGTLREIHEENRHQIPDLPSAIPFHACR
jgi:hypothetical protein